MTDLSNAARSQALNSLDGGAQNLLAFVALFVSDPGTTGASGENAATGGYARQGTITWGASSGGSNKTNTTAMTFSTAGTVPVGWLGMFSAVTAGTYGIGALINSGSTVTATTITVAGGAVALAAS